VIMHVPRNMQVPDASTSNTRLYTGKVKVK